MTSFSIFRDGEAGLSRVSLLADGCIWLTACLLDSLHLAVCGRGTEGGGEDCGQRWRPSSPSSGQGFACQSPGLQISLKIK